MPIIWCSISAHGFGHAAQIIPILNELGREIKNVQVILRTCVSDSIFREYLQVPWERQAAPQDIGCVQRGPLDIDIEATWRAYQAFHDDWIQRVRQEAQAMQEVQPHLVLSNISHLAIASGVQVKCPAIAVASLSWDQVLEPFINSSLMDQQLICQHIRQEYAKADALIRLHPGIDMPAFSSITDTGPSFPVTGSPSQDVRKLLGFQGGEKLVLIAFGGVPLTSLPFEEMEACEEFHFLVAGLSFNQSFKRIHRIEGVPLPFGEIMKQADVVMTKPGYATITTAVHEGIALVYVRRHNFVDEQRLVDYAHHYGRAVEMTRDDFEKGAWRDSLKNVLAQAPPLHASPKPEHSAAIRLLREFLKTS